MSFELGDAVVKVRADSSRLSSDVSSGISGAFSGSSIMGSLNSVGSVINRTIVGAFAAAGAAGVATLGYALSGGMTRVLDTEDARKMFGQLGLGIDETDNLLGNLDETFRKGSFAYPDVYDVSSQLMASGTAMEDLNDRTLVTGNMAAFAGAELGEIGTILSVISANGKVSANELNRLADAGIPIKSILAEALGVSQEELMNMVSAGEVTTDMFFDAAGGAAQLDGAMEGMADTTRGAWANFKTGIAGVGEALLAPWFGENGTMVTFLQGLGDKIYANMDTFTRWGEVIYNVGTNFIANSLVPAMERLGTIITETIIPAVQAVAGWYDRNSEAIGRIVAALVPAIGIIAGFASVINVLRTAFTLLALATPVGIILALVTALIYAYQNSEAFRDIVNSAFESLRNFVGPIIESIVGWIRGIGTSTSETGTWLSETWAQIQGIFQSAIDAITAIFTFFYDFATDVWNRFGEHLLSAAEQIWEHIKQLISGVLDVIQGVFEVFAGAFTGDWSRVWDGIKQIFSGVWDAIKAILGTAFTAIKTILGAAVATISSMWSAAWDRIKSFFSSVWESIKSIIASVLASIVSSITSRVNSIRDTISNVFNTIKDTMSNAINTAKDLVVNAFNTMKSSVSLTIGTLMSTVSGIPGRILSALGNVGSMLLSAGRSIVQGLINGITDKLGALRRKASELASAVRNFLPFSPAEDGPFSGKGAPEFSGQAIAQDLLKGIAANTPEVSRAAHNLMQGVRDEMGGDLGVGAGLAGRRGVGGRVGDSFTIEKVEIAARDLQEMQNVKDFFDKIQQTARAGAS